MLHLVPPHMLPLLHPPGASARPAFRDYSAAAPPPSLHPPHLGRGAAAASSMQAGESVGEGEAEGGTDGGKEGVWKGGGGGLAWTVVLCGRDKATLDECESGVRAVWGQLKALLSISASLHAPILIAGGGCAEVHIGQYLDMRAALATEYLGVVRGRARGGVEGRGSDDKEEVQASEEIRREQALGVTLSEVVRREDQRRVVAGVAAIAALVTNLACYLIGHQGGTRRAEEVVEELKLVR